MKLKFNLKSKEASLEADVEGLVEKGMERHDNPNRKTRYQIKQEEKRRYGKSETRFFLNFSLKFGQCHFLLFFLYFLAFFLSRSFFICSSA